MRVPEKLLSDLPDPEAASRFFARIQTDNETAARRLVANESLLSDILALAAYSPLLAATIEQNPEYIGWLEKHRREKGIRSKEELLESLARFALTNSVLDHQVTIARFRRRELLRIFLADIRRQLAIAETTEELSNLADAILENALRIARQEMDNRYGAPLEVDERGRKRDAVMCIASLGKLGSRELNYSSDIDLLFLYSADGETSGTGSRGKVTNREYFVKLAERIVKLIGQQTGEGAAYRVDLRLRPHGRVGPLAMSTKDTVRYYLTEAAAWERQVLIRSRGSAGDTSLFDRFFAEVGSAVFSESQSVDGALRSVRLSKQKIDLEHRDDRGFDVKLGRGGIREIEFIAQALQLAHGGRDRWLRASHTLISLSRLADRSHINDDELSRLFGAYEFLRRLEHILQMENGLQTHAVPNDTVRRRLVASRMRFASVEEFDSRLRQETSAVSSIFRRVFADRSANGKTDPLVQDSAQESGPATAARREDFSERSSSSLQRLAAVSPKFAELIAATGIGETVVSDDGDELLPLDLTTLESGELRTDLARLRKRWVKHLVGIAALEAEGKIDIQQSKRRQTALAEASINAALGLAEREMERRSGESIVDLDLAVLGLGKLGGGAIDYDSDLDVILVFQDNECPIGGMRPIEFNSRAAEVFVDALSGYTREGNLYRVDLRLRPHGKNGPNVISRSAFIRYVGESAAVWELLAYVKLRGAGGPVGSATSLEQEVVSIVHARGAAVPAEELAAETRRMRALLEKERGAVRRGSVNLKYGSGGMLDIYFAIRFLQLRDNVRDLGNDRSSESTIRRLLGAGSLTQGQSDSLLAGHQFLSRLDHELRFLIGRTHIVPHEGHPIFPRLLERMSISSASEFVGQLSLHRIAIREAFDGVTATKSR